MNCGLECLGFQSPIIWFPVVRGYKYPEKCLSKCSGKTSSVQTRDAFSNTCLSTVISPCQILSGLGGRNQTATFAKNHLLYIVQPLSVPWEKGGIDALPYLIRELRKVRCNYTKENLLSKINHGRIPFVMRTCTLCLICYSNSEF